MPQHGAKPPNPEPYQISSLYILDLRQNLQKLEEQRNSGRRSRAHKFRGNTKTCCCEGRGHKLWKAASVLFPQLVSGRPPLLCVLNRL